MLFFIFGSCSAFLCSIKAWSCASMGSTSLCREAFFNALVFAKVMMLFEVFDPGRWLRKWPLIYPILHETLLLTVLFLVTHVIEKTIEGLFRGKTLTESMTLLTGAVCQGSSASPSFFLSR